MWMLCDNNIKQKNSHGFPWADAIFNRDKLTMAERISWDMLFTAIQMASNSKMRETPYVVQGLKLYE